MSRLTKVLIMLAAWLIFSLVAFKTCIEPPCCGADGAVTEDTEETAPVTPVVEDYALRSQIGNGDVEQGNLWPDLRARLLAEYRDNPDQELEIFGNYYGDETAPDGYENMGFYRAEQIKNMLVPDIPADKIRPLARLLEGDSPDPEDSWDAGAFNWSAISAGDEEPTSEVIQLDSDEIIIRFPFSSDEKEPDPNVDAYLEKLAQRLQQTDENVSITGHTDNISSNAFNMRLGQRRADYIKRILVQYGAPEDRITTRSRGEESPTDTNATEAGRTNNRRAVVRLSSSAQ